MNYSFRLFQVFSHDRKNDPFCQERKKRFSYQQSWQGARQPLEQSVGIRMPEVAIPLQENSHAPGQGQPPPNPTQRWRSQRCSGPLAFLTKVHKERAATRAAQLPGLEACLLSLCRLLEMNHDKIKFSMRLLPNQHFCVCECVYVMRMRGTQSRVPSEVFFAKLFVSPDGGDPVTSVNIFLLGHPSRPGAWDLGTALGSHSLSLAPANRP